METYSLSCQYLGRMQITRGLTRQDLLNPVIFQVCGSYLGETTDCGKFMKFASGRFVSLEDRSELSTDPLLWPGGEAQEVRVAPWHHAGEPVLPSLKTEVQHVLLHGDPEKQDRLFLEAMYIANDLLEAEGFNGLDYLDDAGRPVSGVCGENAGRIETDWEKTFSPEGPNGDKVQWLDYAMWCLRLETGQVSSPAAPPAAVQDEEYQTARWQFSETAGASVTWWRDALTAGAYLQQWEKGAHSSLMFDCVPEALAALSLKSGLSPVQLLRTFRYEQEQRGSYGSLSGICDSTYTVRLPAVRA